MARERVYAYSDPTYRNSETSDPEPVQPGVEVTFHREGNEVGLATGHLTDTTFDDSDPSHNKVTTPYHVWLSRSEVNTLIRNLRRARNVAFGVDE